MTERERAILQLLAEGQSNKEAAAVLNLSPYTVETHRTNMMQKLGLHNTAEIVLYADLLWRVSPLLSMLPASLQDPVSTGVIAPCQYLCIALLLSLRWPICS